MKSSLFSTGSKKELEANFRRPDRKIYGIGDYGNGNRVPFFLQRICSSYEFGTFDGRLRLC